MKNILLPTDFSKNSKNAIRFAMKFFEGEACTFHILNTQKPSSYLTADVRAGSFGSSVYEGVLADNKKELEKMITFCESISEKEDFTFVPKIDFANIVDAVNQAVAINDIELIVMGTNGATGAAEVLFGSNTLNLIRNANCPVLAIPQGYIFEKIQSVLLSVNYQYDVTDEALEVLLKIVRKNKAVLKILEVEEDKIEVMPQKIDFREHFKDITFERFCIKNLPYPMAINAFEQLIPIQLHAMFLERKSFLDRFIFGSDTSKISYTSPAPLLVLK
ncbi:universal stress protein [Aequorivita todarodis]|uniref:universal stress protein n=1 Tax=Aequorivita todarodis TaxID=2036821 RepID=UPI002350E93B|nr:universal stress protein [Aequorivita todarodis]MDC8001344.1 universal stress protein [Aequorivita todarodis]